MNDACNCAGIALTLDARSGPADTQMNLNGTMVQGLVPENLLPHLVQYGRLLLGCPTGACPLLLWN